jgi:hypothetical protein
METRIRNSHRAIIVVAVAYALLLGGLYLLQLRYLATAEDQRQQREEASRAALRREMADNTAAVRVLEGLRPALEMRDRALLDSLRSLERERDHLKTERDAIHSTIDAYSAGELQSYFSEHYPDPQAAHYLNAWAGGERGQGPGGGQAAGAR